MFFLNLIIFMADRYGDSLVRTPTYEPCDKSLEISSEALAKRLKKVELTVTPQKSNQNAKNSAGSRQQQQQQKTVTPGVFPLLDPSKFEGKTNSAIFVRGIWMNTFLILIFHRDYIGIPLLTYSFLEGLLWSSLKTTMLWPLSKKRRSRCLDILAWHMCFRNRILAVG